MIKIMTQLITDTYYFLKINCSTLLRKQPTYEFDDSINKKLFSGDKIRVKDYFVADNDEFIGVVLDNEEIYYLEKKKISVDYGKNVPPVVSRYCFHPDFMFYFENYNSEKDKSKISYVINYVKTMLRMKIIKSDLNVYQFTALVSFILDSGVSTFFKTNIVELLNSNQHDKIPEELSKWVTHRGKVQENKITLRKAEAEFFQKKP